MFYLLHSCDIEQAASYLVSGPPESGKSSVLYDIASSFEKDYKYTFLYDFSQTTVGNRAKGYIPNNLHAVKLDTPDQFESFTVDLIGTLNLKWDKVLFLVDGLDQISDFDGVRCKRYIKAFSKIFLERCAYATTVFTVREMYTYLGMGWNSVINLIPAEPFRYIDSYDYFGRVCKCVGTYDTKEYLIDYRTGRTSWAYDYAKHQRGENKSNIYSIGDYINRGLPRFVSESTERPPKEFNALIKNEHERIHRNLPL